MMKIEFCATNIDNFLVVLKGPHYQVVVALLGVRNEDTRKCHVISYWEEGDKITTPRV